MALNFLKNVLGQQPAKAVGPQQIARIDRLHQLLENVPVERQKINEWSAECAGLIEQLVISRLEPNELATILTGLISYQKTGITSQYCHQAFVQAFGKSSGLLQETLHYALFPRANDNSPAVLSSPHVGDLSKDERAKIISDLKENGYSVLPRRLSDASLSAMIDATKRLKFSVLEPNDAGVPSSVEGVDPASPPNCGAARARAQDMASHPVFAEVAHDPVITSIATEYLQTPATAIDSVMWYTFSSNNPSSELAQLFHYDLDTIRWLKAFYYLSDVDEKSGPHEYVEGSHLAGAKSQELLDRGYVRISDQDIADKQKGNVRSITGPAGTIILGDTRAFHRGLKVASGHRLIFSPIYAPSKISYVHGG